jgi:hypothetical protein
LEACAMALIISDKEPRIHPPSECFMIFISWHGSLCLLGVRDSMKLYSRQRGWLLTAGASFTPFWYTGSPLQYSAGDLTGCRCLLHASCR